ncbi:hypothetical protein [Enterococcus crotali]
MKLQVRLISLDSRIRMYEKVRKEITNATDKKEKHLNLISMKNKACSVQKSYILEMFRSYNIHKLLVL